MSMASVLLVPAAVVPRMWVAVIVVPNTRADHAKQFGASTTDTVQIFDRCPGCLQRTVLPGRNGPSCKHCMLVMVVGESCGHDSWSRMYQMVHFLASLRR